MYPKESIEPQTIVKYTESLIHSIKNPDADLLNKNLKKEPEQSSSSKSLGPDFQHIDLPGDSNEKVHIPLKSNQQWQNPDYYRVTTLSNKHDETPKFSPSKVKVNLNKKITIQRPGIKSPDV